MMTKKLSDRMDAAMTVMDGERVRWLLGKKLPLTQGENVFGKRMAENRYDLILMNAASAEFTRTLILEEVLDKPKSCVQVGEALDMDPGDVLKHMIALRKWRHVEEAGEKGGYLLFQATTQGRAACEGV
jgi:predicted ArsR family transcriptional regulator